MSELETLYGLTLKPHLNDCHFPGEGTMTSNDIYIEAGHASKYLLIQRNTAKTVSLFEILQSKLKQAMRDGEFDLSGLVILDICITYNRANMEFVDYYFKIPTHAPKEDYLKNENYGVF